MDIATIVGGQHVGIENGNCKTEWPSQWIKEMLPLKAF